MSSNPRRGPRLLALLALLLALFVIPALAAQYWIYSSESQEALDTELRRTQTRARTIAALVARGVDPFHAAAGGAFLHGRAAALGPADGLVASDVASHLPAALAEVRR